MGKSPLFAVSAFGPPQAASKTLRVLTEPGRGFSPASLRQIQKPAGAGFVLAERGIAQLLTTLTLFAVSAFGPPQAASKTLRVLTEPGRG
ncbi:MAG: hypothetical protein RL657_1508, partial [Pseudomonadota bacterium]